MVFSFCINFDFKFGIKIGNNIFILIEMCIILNKLVFLWFEIVRN